MPVDNQIYNAPGDIWWEESRPLNALRTAINPGRIGYLRDVLKRRGIDARATSALDVGCGGGLMAEEVAALGLQVTGVDPSPQSIATARRHAASSGARIEYVEAAGEKLPFPDASFGLVYCCDVLEHVDDVDRVVSEAARVLKPGGVYLYDTINRTSVSRVVMIKLFQEWRSTAFMPPGLHDWDSFIKPTEIHASLTRAGLDPVETVGLKPAANPIRLFFLLRQVKKGSMSPAEMGRRSPMAISRDHSVLYAGHAVKAGRAPSPGRPAGARTAGREA
jgi:2-polyprenyl-6-hydroxyphenyl methylase / 3-demethylubiquinone-9 3-methyltransferase